MSKKGVEYVTSMAEDYGISLPENPLLQGEEVPFGKGVELSIQGGTARLSSGLKEALLEGLQPGVAFLSDIQRTLVARDRGLSRNDIPQSSQTLSVQDEYCGRFGQLTRPHSVTLGRLSGFCLELLAQGELPSRALTSLKDPRFNMVEGAVLPIAVKANLKGKGGVVGHALGIFVARNEPEEGDVNPAYSLDYKAYKLPNLAKEQFGREHDHEPRIGRLPGHWTQ